MNNIKKLLLSIKSKVSHAGLSRAQMRQHTAILQEFVAKATFDETIVLANDKAYTRLSIVMPSYNQVHFIERSILSVLNQNYPNLQFIIMDGGSTDGTLDVIRKYEKYLIWRSEPDNGQADAINKAVMLADGELVGWQNSDDVYFPGVFHRIHEISLKRPQAVLYSGTVVVIDREDRMISIMKFNAPSKRRLLYEGCVTSSQSVFWRREVQSQTGLYDSNLQHAMDYDFWIRILAHGPAEFTPEILGGWRVYEGTKTSVAGARGTVESRVIRNKYGIDDRTMRWKLTRAGMRISRLLKWVLVTRTNCKTIAV